MSSKRVREEFNVELPVISLALDKIKVDESKNLRRFEPNAKSVEELALDIRKNGMINPVSVRKLEGDGEYELVAGYQRMKSLAWLNDNGNKIDTVKASVVEIPQDQPNKSKILNLAENVRRNELSYIDAGFAIKDLMDAGMTGQDIAKEFKKSGAWVSYCVSFLTLRAEIQKKIHEGKINWRLARTLPDLTPEEQDAAIKETEGGASASEVARRAKAKKPRKNKRGRKSRGDQTDNQNISSKQAILQLEELAQELGTPEEGKKVSKTDEWAIELYKGIVKYLSGGIGVKALHNRIMKVL